MAKIKPRHIFFFLFFLILRPGYGQGYLVHHYSESEGLPSATVQDVTQDHLGRIWFATRAGISCYDGSTWKNYTVSHGLPSLSFIRITVDRKGRIWALADIAYGISVVYNDGGNRTYWKRIDMEKTGSTVGLIEVNSFCLIEKKNVPIIAVGTENHGIFLHQGKEWTNIREKDGLLSNSINGIVYTNNSLYAVTDRGLSVIKINGTITVDNRLNRVLSFPPGGINGITIEEIDKYPDYDLKNRRIWVCGYQWIGYFEEHHSKLTVFPAKELTWEQKKPIHLLPDYYGGMYAGLWHTVLYFTDGDRTQQHLGLENGLISDGANSLFIDFEKNIWISCNHGVSKISSRRFGNFQKADGLLEDEVTAILEYEPGKFVLGHNKGITFYENGRFSRLPLHREKTSRIPILRILDIAVDSHKNIWLASAWAGLTRVDSRRRITRYGEKDGLVESIISLWIDRSDNVWLGTERGVYRFNGEKVELKEIGEFGKVSARKIYGSGNTLRYIASYSAGVYVNLKNRWQNYQVPGNQKANNVYTVKKDSRERLFIGTLDGLYILTGENLRKFKAADFSIDRPVYFIREDKHKQLWFGTDNGVIRWDGKKARKYSVSEGLSGQETNRAAGIFDNEGRLWIGTNRGLSIYNEAFDNRESFKPVPRTQLLYIKVFDKKIPFNGGRSLQLHFDENTIAFHFKGISFIDEAQVRFKCKLVGFDSEWSGEKYLPNQVVTYTSLPAGTYRFLLKARNGLGNWSEVITTPTIIIPDPFYRKWWFFLAVFLAAGSLFYIIFRFFSEKRNAALLERKVEERSKQLEKMQQKLIQSQKMEAVGTLAGGIAHDFNNILGIILGNSEIILEETPPGAPLRESVETIQTAAERAAGLVRQILTFSRRSSQQPQPLKLGVILEEAIKVLLPSLPSTIVIRQNIRCDRDFVLANHVELHQLFLNLGANAAHAMQEHGGVLEVRLFKIELDSEAAKGYENINPGAYLQLTVSDSGQGMAPSVKKRIFEPFFTTKKTGEGSGMGLAVVHGIVKSHGGAITVDSKPGQGTTFNILLPQIAADENQSPVPAEIPGVKERILLVDDEAALPYIKTEILGRLGYGVTGESNPAVALETVRRTPEKFDLLITDLNMPQMTGIRLAQEVRRFKPGMPVIFCSGFNTAISREQIREFGTNNFILKPFNKQDLAEIIRKILDKN